MNTHIVPEEHRLLKARAIAATPGAILQVSPTHFKVQSQSAARYYNVWQLGPASWQCTCPDNQRRQLDCKHTLAVQELLTARAESHRFAESHQLTRAQVRAMLAERQAEINSAYDQQRLATFWNAITTPTVPFELRYWWPDYTPQELFDHIRGLTYQEPEGGIQVKTRADTDWRPLRSSLDALRDYIHARDLHLVDTHIERTRNARSWQARYILTFATNGHGQFAPQPQAEVPL